MNSNVFQIQDHIYEIKTEAEMRLLNVKYDMETQLKDQKVGSLYSSHSYNDCHVNFRNVVFIIFC